MITKHSNIVLTNQQEEALEQIKDFLNSDIPVFILKGYAGTGKTTLTSCLVNYLKEIKRTFSLAAPTGRAANVISQKTGERAVTIHKTIYSYHDLVEYESKDEDGEVTFKYYFGLGNNSDVVDNVFIIDEASMVSDIYSEGEFFRFGSGKLLKDLIEFSKVGTLGAKVKIIFIGDPAQLEPVGMNFSPALCSDYLLKEYNLESREYELTETHRQEADSGIVSKSIQLRRSITSDFFNNFDINQNGTDVFKIDLENFLSIYFKNETNSLIVTYKNKTALDFNKRIRELKFPNNLSITTGDHIIIGRNNYKHFIFNGEFGIVIKAEKQTVTRNIPVYERGQKHIVPLTWRYVELLFKDENNSDKIVSGYMLENYFESDANDLQSLEMKALYIDFKIRNPQHEANSEEFKQAIRDDVYFNAIHLKYGYAVTCHKAQGGEWDNVFVIWDYAARDGFNFLEDNHEVTGKKNISFFRWAYTAVTRAKRVLFNINPPYFSPFSNITYIPTIARTEQAIQTGKKESVEVINVDKTLKQVLANNGLNEVPTFIQHKFVELHHLLSDRFIEVSRYDAKQYQEFYSFSRDDKKVNLIFFYNGKEQFTRFNLVGNQNSEELYNEINNVLNQNRRFEIKFIDFQKENPVSPIAQIEQKEFAFEKEFLQIIFESIKPLVNNKMIYVDDIEHLQYRERYHFKRGRSLAIIDFIYDSDGFFTSAEERKSSNCDMMIDLYEVVKSLKEPSYVV
jgi:DNA polymerase III delta prime subunit